MKDADRSAPTSRHSSFRAFHSQRSPAFMHCFLDGASSHGSLLRPRAAANSPPSRRRDAGAPAGAPRSRTVRSAASAAGAEVHRHRRARAWRVRGAVVIVAAGAQVVATERGARAWSWSLAKRGGG